MKGKYLLSATLAALIALGCSESIIFANDPGITETEEDKQNREVRFKELQDKFEREVWPAIQSQENLTYTVHYLNKDGSRHQTLQESYSKAQFRVNDIFVGNTEENKDEIIYSVHIIPELKDHGILYQTGVNWRLFTADPDSPGKYKLIESETGEISIKLLSLKAGHVSALYNVAYDDFIVGSVPESLSKVMIRCRQDNSSEYFDVSLDNCPISDITNIASFDQDITSSGGIASRTINGSIPLDRLTEKLEKKTGKKIKYNSFQIESFSDPLIATESAAAPSIIEMLKNNTLVGVFEGNDADGYYCGFENERIVINFTTQPTGSSSQPSSSKPGSSSNPTSPSKPTSSSTPKESYRLYNPLTGEHFFTTNKAEYDSLKAGGVWKAEASTWKAPEKSDFPIYRVCNPNTGAHHYTMDSNERDVLVRLGWRDEGIGMYSADQDGMAVYRLYNPNAKIGSHHYTTNASERDSLVALGWKNEGVGFYGLK